MPFVRMVAMTGGDLYENAIGPNTGNFMWGLAYSDLFPDLDAIIAIATEGGNQVHLGAAKIMKAYVMMTLVDLYGDVPYL